MIRINSYIASCTEYSRRQAESFIRRGQVSINGRLSTDLAVQVDLNDKVKLDNNIITPLQKVYYILNKPTGYVSSVKDKHAEKLVTDLVPKNPPVYPIGRLDKNSRGLIILTNDGELAQKLAHPKFLKEKEYEVEIDKELTNKDTETLKNGIKLEQGLGKFDSINKKGSLRYRIVLHQGIKRQIREMLNALGIQVKDLLRVRIARIRLIDLSAGEYRKLSKSDIIKMID